MYIPELLNFEILNRNKNTKVVMKDSVIFFSFHYYGFLFVNYTVVIEMDCLNMTIFVFSDSKSEG